MVAKSNISFQIDFTTPPMYKFGCFGFLFDVPGMMLWQASQYVYISLYLWLRRA